MKTISFLNKYKMRILAGTTILIIAPFAIEVAAADENKADSKSVDSVIQGIQERLKQLKEMQPAQATETSKPKTTVNDSAPKAVAQPDAKTAVKTAASAVPKKHKRPRAVEVVQEGEKNPSRAPASYRPPALQDKPKPAAKEENDAKPNEGKSSPSDAKSKELELKGGGQGEAPKVTEPTTQAPAPQEEAEASQLTGDWGGARKKISDKGLDIAVIYKGELNRNVSGGLQRRTVYLENLDVRFLIDFEKAAGLKGLSAFFYGLGDFGGDRKSSPSKNVGDAQVTSNIETSTDSFKLYEAWFQQVLFEDHVSVLFGLHDLNSEFYATDSSSLFFNSSFGVGKELSQTAANGPSIFPTTAVALRLRVEPNKSFYFQSALFNAQAGDPSQTHDTRIRYGSADGLLGITEAAYLPGVATKSTTPGKYALGFWTYTRTFDHMSEANTSPAGDAVPVQSTSHGTYFLADQHLSENVSAFARFGVASTETNRFGRNVSAGVVWTGAIPSRSKDRVGLGATQVTNGGQYKELVRQSGGITKDSETTYELNYRFEAFPGLALQPDFQYVQNPNTDPDINHASVVAMRVEINF